MEFIENIGAWIGYLWDPVREFLLEADNPAQKLVLMVIAIVLFVVVMGGILLAVDKPKKVPRWVVTSAFAGPALLAMAFGLVYPAIRTIYTSFFLRNSDEYIGLDNYVTAFTQNEFQIVLRNTAIWVILVPILSTFIGLVYAVVVDRSRFEKIAKASSSCRWPSRWSARASSGGSCTSSVTRCGTRTAIPPPSRRA